MQASTEGISILLVEDNDIDVEITKRVLARSGWELTLHVAHDGKEALEFLERQQLHQEANAGLPNLVLLDLRLPGIDGLEVLRRIKDDPFIGAIPVAVLTGLRGERPVLESMACGGNMYITKPITQEDAADLIPAVRKYWDVISTLQQEARRRSAA